MSLLVFEFFNGSLPFYLFSEPTATTLESVDGVSDEESQEEDDNDLDDNGHGDTEDDTENQIESINLSSLPASGNFKIYLNLLSFNLPHLLPNK